VGVIAIKASGDPAVHLEFTKAAFNEIALAIDPLLVPVAPFKCLLGWNDHLHSLGADKGSNLVGIVTFVGNHRLGRLALLQQCGALAIGFFPCGQKQA
jgi:hypothetical protein